MTPKEIENIKNYFPDFDLEIISKIIYWDGWTSYEEHGGLFIFEAFDGSYQKIEYGSCVFGDPSNYATDIFEITLEEMKSQIQEMNDIINYYQF